MLSVISRHRRVIAYYSAFSRRVGIVISVPVSVCLSICDNISELTGLKFTRFPMHYLQPLLGPPVAALKIWNMLCTEWHHILLCAQHSSFHLLCQVCSGVLGVYAVYQPPVFWGQRILTSAIINKQGTFRPFATPLCVYPPPFLAIHHCKYAFLLRCHDSEQGTYE